MDEYKVKGLSCGSCCNHGEHESSHHRNHEHSDPEHNDQHAQSNHHSHGTDLQSVKLLILASVFYFAAICLSPYVVQPIVIGMYLIAIVISGYSTFIRGLKNLFRFIFNIDTLMTIALIGAVAIGEWNEATLVAILFGLNELLEGFGAEKARHSMEALLQVAPKQAVRIKDGLETIVPITALVTGDIVLVKPGAKVPSDGTVLEGKSSVNEAAITGESLPIDKAMGEFVYGGSINNEGVLQVRIDKVYQDSSLAKILHLVEEAQETKTPAQLFINKFARYYTPLIMIVAALVMLAPPLLLHGDWSKWFYQGLAVLIVGCPCALILASPIAILSGITRNARNGILVKGGVFLEQLGKINILAFDKTGTLTKGEPDVEETVVFDEMRFFEVAAAIESTSSHPLAKAIINYISVKQNTAMKGCAEAKAEDIQTVPGRGVTAKVNGEQYWIGNEGSMEHLTFTHDVHTKIDEMKEKGLTLVLAADHNNVLGMFGIADQIRPESKGAIQALHKNGIRQTVMLTGDHQKTAQKVAASVGISSFYSNLLPADKVNIVKELAKQGHVAMIGDGINDAPALAAADLGIAMGKGTDSAIETADIVLMQDHLGKLPEAIHVTKRVNRIIRFNITVALSLKLIALLLTIPGWLTLWIAILSDMGATIFVTLMSLTVLVFNK